MKAEHFCFWLQGYFEISGSSLALTTHQTGLVLAHLELVFAHDKQRGTLAFEFCAHLKGHFTLNPDMLDLSAEQVVLMRKSLGNVFKHEIDPAMGDLKHQTKLNAIHHPSRPTGPGGELLRC